MIAPNTEICYFIALEDIINANPQVATWKDKGGVTALQLAALQRSEGPVRLLLSLLPGSFDAHAKDQALLFALAKHDSVLPLIPAMEPLVEGATLASCDDRGRNALSLAAILKNVRAVGKILENAELMGDEALKAMLAAPDVDGNPA
jgi:ankyrin repeat protein